MKWTLWTLVVLLFASCSNYNQIVKSDDYQAKFNLANELFDEGKYERCVALYEQVYQRSPKSPEGELSFYRLGKACYNVEDWYLASYYLSAFPLRFPYSTKVEEATFLAALCAVHNSPEPSLDQHETEVALNELQNFAAKFPFSERMDTCNLVMDQMRKKLEAKDLMNVKLYSRTENYRAAVVSAEQFLENYPVTENRELAYYILIRNSYLLTINSVDAKIEERTKKTNDWYQLFLAEFPNSKYLREFQGYISALTELNSNKQK